MLLIALVKFLLIQFRKYQKDLEGPIMLDILVRRRALNGINTLMLFNPIPSKTIPFLPEYKIKKH